MTAPDTMTAPDSQLADPPNLRPDANADANANAHADADADADEPASGAGTREHEATRIIAIRHGETDWNVAGRIQGQLDIPLNANGRWQVRQLAAAVAHEGISTLYSSDLKRALETAQAVAGEGGLTVESDPGLRERGFGVFEGLTFAEISERWPVAAARWRRRDPDFGPEYGETLQQFYTRSVETVRRLAALHPGRTIAIVAHGGVLDCLYRAASHLPLDAPRTWRVDNASINRLLYTPQGFTLIGWSDTAHLDTAQLDPAHLDTAHLDTAQLAPAQLDLAHIAPAHIDRAPLDGLAERNEHAEPDEPADPPGLPRPAEGAR